MENKSECPFCQINKLFLIKEGKSAFVQLSDPCLMNGHLLIIPKRHVERLSELTEEERKEILDLTVEFQDKILGRFASGCDVRQNCRPFLPQSKLKVDHLHVHLLPREMEDELYLKSMIFENEIFRDLTEEERVKFVKLFGL
ncbi:HIT domain protein [uncultured archaeon]|nr:HIT domain protein [uncultured archaeon]